MTKMTKAQRNALQIVANANATGVNATRTSMGCGEFDDPFGNTHYCISMGMYARLEAMGLVSRVGYMQVFLTEAGRAIVA